MILKSYRDEENLLSDYFLGGIEAISDDFTREFLSLLYPLNVISRVIYKPMLGRWYPFIDVKTEGYDRQLFFFYGKLSLRLSIERICSSCGKSLILENNNNSAFFPVALCSDCSRFVYFGYRKCLRDLYDLSNLSFELSGKNNKRVLCEDFLNPRCGYPIDSEVPNPCLRGHGIGLIMVDDSTLKVIIGPVSVLKYRMIWEGGLFGLILGYSDRILNLEFLRRILGELFKVVRFSLDEFNANSLGYIGKNGSFYFGNYKVRLVFSDLEFFDLFRSRSLSQWLFVNFFRYYKNFCVKLYLNKFFKRPLFFLKFLVERIIGEIDIDIIEFLELFRCFTPFSFELRENYERDLLDLLKIDDISLFSGGLVDSLESVSYRDILGVFSKIGLIKFNELKDGVELREILCALGSFLIVRCDLSDEPLLLNLNDLIGRKVY
ncbi:MAG: hypothetical protein ACTSQS_11150 [Promethearchaeota archaeon]